MRFRAQRYKRFRAGTMALLLLLATAVPLLSSRKAEAYGLLSARTIKMSSSANGTLAAGQDVTYEVEFTVTSDTQNIGGMVIQFCSNSPIIGDSCTAPAGMDVDAANLAFAADGTGLTVDSGESAANLIVLNHATSYDPGAAEVITFTFGTAAANDGIDNPENVNTTFYGRLVTFTTAAGADAYTATVIGTEPPVVDAGGVALSTAEQITIQAKVQERLTFCVYTSAVNTSNCTVTTDNPVALGDTNGVLSSTAPSISKDAKYNVSTNAASGVIIRAKSSFPTLTSGGNTIDATAAGGAAGATYSSGTEQFGLCNYRVTTSAAGLAAAANYDGGASEATCEGTTDGQTAGFDNGATFTFDTTTGGDNLTTTYGDTIATKSAGNLSTGVLVFLGGISDTTEPGIYTTTMTFIATGTY